MPIFHRPERRIVSGWSKYAQSSAVLNNDRYISNLSCTLSCIFGVASLPMQETRYLKTVDLPVEYAPSLSGKNYWPLSYS